MNREIKFRAWSLTSKKMIYRVIVGNTTTDNPCSLVWDARSKDWVNFDKHCGKIMQYTGIKDKNGKEIYEGDILECKFKPTYSEEFHHIGIYHVVFDKASFKVKRIKLTSNPQYNPPSLLRIGENRQKRNEFMIIGNIYENPYLLEKK